jgi:hypothetical protein
MDEDSRNQTLSPKPEEEINVLEIGAKNPFIVLLCPEHDTHPVQPRCCLDHCGLNRIWLPESDPVVPDSSTVSTEYSVGVSKSLSDLMAAIAEAVEAMVKARRISCVVREPKGLLDHTLVEFIHGVGEGPTQSLLKRLLADRILWRTANVNWAKIAFRTSLRLTSIVWRNKLARFLLKLLLWLAIVTGIAVLQASGWSMRWLRQRRASNYHPEPALNHAPLPEAA